MKKYLITLVLFVAFAFVFVPLAYAQDGSPAGKPVTVELLVGIMSALASLAVTFIPSLRDWYDKKDRTGKQQVQAILLLLIVGGLFGISCTPYGAQLGLAVACKQADLYTLGQLLFVAISTNQTTYLLTRK